MKKMIKKAIVSILAFTFVLQYSAKAVYATSNNISEINVKKNYVSVVNIQDGIPQKYEGVDLFKSNFDSNKMTEKEKELYNYLLDKEVEKYIENNADEYVEDDIKKQIKEILENNTLESSNIDSNEDSGIITFRSAPWWHLNTVSKVGGAINVVIGAALAAVGGGLASGGIRALIAKIGEAEAKKIVKNQILNKVKNKLLIWGMTGMASKIGNGLLQVLMWATDPGTRIAEMLDANDAHPNNGYIEAW